MDYVDTDQHTKNNSPEALHRIKEYAEEKANDIYFTEKGEIFERAFPCNDLKQHQIKPTIDNEYYAKMVDLKDDLVGYFTGDPDEWIPILIRDQFLLSASYVSVNESAICIAEIEFPEGTPYFKGQRPAVLADSDTFLDEQFVVYDQPIKPKNVRKVSDSEMDEFFKRENEILNEEDKWGEDEY